MVSCPKKYLLILCSLQISWWTMLINWKKVEAPSLEDMKKVLVPMHFSPVPCFDKCWPVPNWVFQSKIMWALWSWSTKSVCVLCTLSQKCWRLTRPSHASTCGHILNRKPDHSNKTRTMPTQISAIVDLSPVKYLLFPFKYFFSSISRFFVISFNPVSMRSSLADSNGSAYFSRYCG